MARVAAAIVILGASLAWAGCTLVDSVSGYASGGPRTSCPDAGPPVMVPAGSYCVDSTEVTRGQYQTFLAAKGGDAGGQPSYCSFNGDYTPTCSWPPSADSNDFPAICVDWCDALAYCAWAGKRLCGAIDGGHVDDDAAADPSAGQWAQACTDDGQRVYPYGNVFDGSVCNGYGYMGLGALVAVKSASGCVGGYPGIFDMSSNAREWIDSCTSFNDPQGSEDCSSLGGSYEGPTEAVACASLSTQARDSNNVDLGFRCCTP